MERVAHPTWHHGAALVGAFAGAVGLGAALAWLTHPASVLARGVAGFALLAILMLGYQLWVAHIMAVLVRGLFRGIRRALVRAVFTRKSDDVVTEARTLLDQLRDPQAIADMTHRIRARARLFRTLGAVVGIATGLGFGLTGSALGFPTTFLLYAAAATWYGFILARLGWLGWLPIPEDLEV